VDNPPTLTWVRGKGGTLSQVRDGATCTSGYGTSIGVSVDASDDRDPSTALSLVLHWSGVVSGSARMSWDGYFYGVIGPFDEPSTPDEGGRITTWVTGTDRSGHTSTLAGPAVDILRCYPIIIY